MRNKHELDSWSIERGAVNHARRELLGGGVMVYLIETIDGNQWNCEAQSITGAVCKAVAEFGEDKVISVTVGEDDECN